MKPITTEKAVMMIERENVLVFETGMEMSKDEIKREVEEVYGVEVEGVRTLIKKNKKYAYVKLKENFPAIDVATKLGMI